MKLTRWGLVVLLCSIAVPGYAYQLRAVQGAPVDDESAGQEFIEVVLEREPGDVGACQVDGVVEAIELGLHQQRRHRRRCIAQCNN